LAPIILRVAGWPVETIARLRSPDLAEGVDRWLDRHEALCREAARLSELLHDLIPCIGEGPRRAAALVLRRHLHRSADPVPDALLTPLLTWLSLPAVAGEFLRRHVSARLALALEWRQLEFAYESSLAAELAELRRLAAAPDFLKALCLASPAAFRALTAPAGRARSGRQWKRDLTVYAYLMRAVGRATPNGLWAGVALESPPDGSEAPVRATSAPGRVVFHPNLGPFARALRAVARSSPSRQSVPLRLNPTLFRVTPSIWQLGNDREGDWHVSQTADHPLLSSLVGLTSDGRARLPRELEAELVARNPGLTGVEAERAVAEMVRDGILWPTLAFPGIFEDPWQALTETVARLPEGEKGPWDTCLRLLTGVCRRLNLHYEDVSVEEMQELLSSARDAVNALLDHYAEPGLPPETQALVADTRARFAFSVSPQLRGTLEQALRLYWAFDRYGLGELQAGLDLRREFGSLGPAEDLPVGTAVRRQEAVHDPSEAGAGPEGGGRETPRSGHRPWEALLGEVEEPSVKARAAGRFRRWHWELEAVFASHRHQLRLEPGEAEGLPLAPGSALVLLHLAGEDCSVRIGSVTPDPCLFYSRFRPQLRPDGPGPDPFLTWYRESQRTVQTSFPGLHFADLATHVSTNLNAASRPRLSPRLLDGLALDSDFATRARVRWGEAGQPRLEVPGCCAALLPRLHSALSLDGADPYTRYFHNLSWLLGRPSLAGPLPPFAAEIDHWHHLPRLYLDETTVISPERWTFPASVGEELATTIGLDRYIVWRRLVRRTGLPGLVYGRYGLHRTETLLPTDSVLAVEDLGRSLTAHSVVFRLAETFPPPGESWVRDADGQHYLAELALAWQGETSFWRGYLGNPHPASAVDR
jgi:hypothetical protein